MALAVREWAGFAPFGSQDFGERRVGEPGADFAGFGGAKAGVDGEGFLPVVAGLACVTDIVMGVAEAVVGTGLAVLIADMGR